MTPSSALPSSSPDTVRAIGVLCVGGDWACAHGDFAALRNVAQRLAARTPEPLHCDLVELANACASDPHRASVLWDQLKPRLYRSGET